VSSVRMAMLAVVTFSFKPLIGGLIYQSQIHVKHGITRQEEEDKYKEAQHEDNPWKRQKEMLCKEFNGKGFIREMIYVPQHSY